MFKEPKEIMLKELKEDMWRVFYQIESINNEIEIIKKKKILPNRNSGFY